MKRLVALILAIGIFFSLVGCDDGSATLSVEYAELCTLVDNEKYTDAVKYYEESQLRHSSTQDYADCKTYYNYAKAMQLWRETQFLTFDDIRNVHELLGEIAGKTSGFKDTDEIYVKISSAFLCLCNNIYIKESVDFDPRLPDMYYGKLITISGDGTIQTGLFGSFDDLGAPSYFPFYCDYELSYINLENGSCFAFAQRSDCEFLILDFDEDSFTIARSDGMDDPFDGTYESYEIVFQRILDKQSSMLNKQSN